MIGNVLAHEMFAVVATIDPDAYAAGTEVSDGVDMSKFEQATFILLLGDIVTNGTVDFTVKSGSDNTTFANTVKAATQLTQAGTDSNKQVVITVRGENLVAGDRYVRAEVVLTTAGADMGLVALGLNFRHSPSSGLDLASVDEVLSS